MMNITQKRLDKAVESRRAIKYFEPSFSIPEKDLITIITTALNIPTPDDCTPFRICRIEKNTELRKKIRNVGFDQPQHTDASILLAMCVDLRILASGLKLDLEADSQLLRDKAMFYSAMFSQGIMVSAASMGYDTCPMIGFSFDEVGKLLNKPEHVILTNFVALGKRCKAPLPRGSKREFNKIVYLNNFPDK
ncbi:nitroreductase family protein [Agarilytica rhodophyticola]|uniref:nitroreductase family protein n=1 Tax=Agarilytica rhodophyticola TaxID=1737490 RepID=UPI001315144E|nr:nitroreductase family protein [Agarilytica rhodophyticola]